MNDVRRYKDKLIKIKKEMQSIYQRTKDLKVREMRICLWMHKSTKEV